MKVKINNIESFRSPENIGIVVDDRVEKIKLINGNCAQDYGHIESGDYFQVTALFHREKFDEIMELWASRTKVTFTDDSGKNWQDMRIVVKSYQHEKWFPDYINLEFEMWRF